MYKGGCATTGDSSAMNMQFRIMITIMKKSNSLLIRSLCKEVRGLIAILDPILLSLGDIFVYYRCFLQMKSIFFTPPPAK
jgi:hypothetical protein